MQILLDLDGVFVDFQGGIHKALGGPPLNPWQWAHNKWNWFEELGWTWEQVDAVCNFDFWANLEWTPDGHDILQTILERFLPEQIYLLSCPMPNIYSASGKMAWVRRNLPEYESQTIITSVSKRFLATPDRLLIDDKNENINGFRDAGGKAILVPRPWNKDYKYADQSAKIVDLEIMGLYEQELIEEKNVSRLVYR